MDLTIIAYLAIGCSAGFIGSMVGLGGGIVLVPALTILMNIDIRQAIGASLISLVATSVMSVSVYSGKNLIHYKFGLILSLFTILGSFIGSYVAVFTASKTLMFLFSGILIVAGYALLRKNHNDIVYDTVQNNQPENDSFFNMQGEIADSGGIKKMYTIRHPVRGMSLSGFAGFISGMLGVGGGLLQVPMMHLVCGMPLKAATATSTFIIGYTGLAGGLVYYIYGNIQAAMTASLIVGLLIGAYIGARTAMVLKTKIIARVLIIVLVLSAIRMLVKAFEM